MTEEEQLELKNIQYKESAARAGLCTMTGEDRTNSKIYHGDVDGIIGKQEQRKILRAFNKSIKIEEIPQSRIKGNTTSDYLSEDSKFLIEVRSLSHIEASKDYSNRFTGGIKNVIEHCIDKRDSSHEGYIRIAGLVVPYLGGFCNDYLIASLKGNDCNIDIESVVKNCKKWNSDIVDAIAIFIEGPPPFSGSDNKIDDVIIAICKRSSRVKSEIFNDCCKLIWI